MLAASALHSRGDGSTLRFSPSTDTSATMRDSVCAFRVSSDCVQRLQLYTNTNTNTSSSSSSKNSGTFSFVPLSVQALGDADGCSLPGCFSLVVSALSSLRMMTMVQ